MSRFIISTLLLFATAFVGVSWAIRGFPVFVPRVGGELRPTVTATFGDTSDQKRHEEAVQEQLQTSGNAKRNDLRLATMQAANAYALSPCEPSFKIELIRSLSAYAQAYQDFLGCHFQFCSNAKIEAAGAAFDSPLDKRVEDALSEAFAKGGIVLEDLPKSVQNPAMTFLRTQGTRVSSCIPSSGRDRL